MRLGYLTKSSLLAAPFLALLASACGSSAGSAGLNGDGGASSAGASNQGGNQSPGGAANPGAGVGPSSGEAGAAGIAELGNAGTTGDAGADGTPSGGIGGNDAGGGSSAGSGGVTAGGAGANRAGASAGGAAGMLAGGGASGAASGGLGGGAAAGAAGASTCATPALSWTPTPNLFTAAIPTSIAVGDLDGDLHPDIAVTGNSAYKGVGLGVLKNKGDGSFAAVKFVDTPYIFNPYTMAMGDLNHDGAADLAVSDGGGVRIFLNSGDATFPVHLLYATSTNVYSIAIGDLNGDTFPDLAVSEGFLVGVLLNAGDGSFPTEKTYSVAAISQTVTSIAIGDLNHDGFPDLVFAEPQKLGVLSNDGTGKFAGLKTYAAGTGLPNVENPISVTIADLNHDKQPDIVTGNYGSDVGSLGVFINDGSGQFAAQVPYTTSANTHATAGLHGDFKVAVVDVDGDKTPDLAVANFGAGTIGVLRGQGDGTFAAEVTHAAGFFPDSVVSGDLNGDGQVDLAVASNNASGSGIAEVFLSHCP